MEPLVIAVLLFALVLVAVLGWAVATYNGFVRLRNVVQESWRQIDVELHRRHDLIPNLVETVKGYMGHERQTLEAVTEARARVDRASGVRDKAAADGQMQQALANLFAVAEAYPDLKASANFQQLQSELSRTEDQLAFARQYYNDAVATLNRTMVTIPWSMLVGMSGVEKGEFYDAPEASTAPPEVRF